MSLTTIRDQLLASLQPTQFSLMNTRLTLDTGVNLRAVRPQDDNDLTLINKVKHTLTDMGVKV